jgi:hypothetical protein
MTKRVKNSKPSRLLSSILESTLNSSHRIPNNSIVNKDKKLNLEGVGNNNAPLKNLSKDITDFIDQAENNSHNFQSFMDELTKLMPTPNLSKQDEESLWAYYEMNFLTTEEDHHYYYQYNLRSESNLTESWVLVDRHYKRVVGGPYSDLSTAEDALSGMLHKNTIDIRQGTAGPNGQYIFPNMQGESKMSKNITEGTISKAELKTLGLNRIRDKEIGNTLGVEVYARNAEEFRKVTLELDKRGVNWAAENRGPGTYIFIYAKHINESKFVQESYSIQKLNELSVSTGSGDQKLTESVSFDSWREQVLAKYPEAEIYGDEKEAFANNLGHVVGEFDSTEASVDGKQIEVTESENYAEFYGESRSFTAEEIDGMIDELGSLLDEVGDPTALNNLAEFETKVKQGNKIWTEEELISLAEQHGLKGEDIMYAIEMVMFESTVSIVELNKLAEAGDKNKWNYYSDSGSIYVLDSWPNGFDTKEELLAAIASPEFANAYDEDADLSNFRERKDGSLMDDWGRFIGTGAMQKAISRGVDKVGFVGESADSVEKLNKMAQFAKNSKQFKKESMFGQFVVDKVLGNEQGVKLVSFKEGTSDEGDYAVVMDKDNRIIEGMALPQLSNVVSTHSSFNDALSKFQNKVAELAKNSGSEKFPTVNLDILDPAKINEYAFNESSLPEPQVDEDGITLVYMPISKSDWEAEISRLYPDVTYGQYAGGYTAKSEGVEVGCWSQGAKKGWVTPKNSQVSESAIPDSFYVEAGDQPNHFVVVNASDNKIVSKHDSWADAENDAMKRNKQEPCVDLKKTEDMTVSGDCTADARMNGIGEAKNKNHLGEEEYNSYSGWKSACRKVNPDCTFEGNNDCCNAKPGVGEWYGDKGCVYNQEKKENTMEESLKKGDKVKRKDNDKTGVVSFVDPEGKSVKVIWDHGSKTPQSVANTSLKLIKESFDTSPFERAGLNVHYSDDKSKAIIKIFAEEDMVKFQKVLDNLLTTGGGYEDVKIKDTECNDCLYEIEITLSLHSSPSANAETRMKERPISESNSDEKTSGFLGKDRASWVDTYDEAGEFSRAEAQELASKMGGDVFRTGDVWRVNKD